MVSRFYAIWLFLIWFTVLLGGGAHAELLANDYIPTTPSLPVPTLSFEDAKGRLLDLKDFRGRYVLLNLWATWCGPCAREMSALDQVRAHFNPQHLMVVPLNEDHDGKVAAQAFYTRSNMPLMPVFIDVSGRAPSLLHARGLPTTLLIDPEGREIGRVEGEADWGTPDALAFLENVMKP